jgi:hypothetical protein
MQIAEKKVAVNCELVSIGAVETQNLRCDTNAISYLAETQNFEKICIPDSFCSAAFDKRN